MQPSPQNRTSKNIFVSSLCFLTLGFVVGCSPGVPEKFDSEKASLEVKHLTLSLFGSMSDATEAKAYKALLDDSAREKISAEAFAAMSKTILSKLGKLKSLEVGPRSDYDPYAGGVLAHVTYVGRFENGDGDIAIGALSVNGSWRILSFNVNSRLLSANPSDYRKNVELYVADSDLVMPGAHVKVVERDNVGKTLIEDAQVLNVRWKLSVAHRQEGFVTVGLSETEAGLIKDAGDLAVKAKK
jgi:hypothetical protein